MPNQPKTPVRTMRIPEDIWAKVLEVARESGTTATAVIIAALRKL